MRMSAHERRQILIHALNLGARLCEIALKLSAIYAAAHFAAKYW